MMIPWLTDCSDGGVLDLSFKSTQQLWKKEYGCDYVIEGGMYRGEPPAGFFQEGWDALTHWMPG
jgi:hypothetical protein